MSEYSHNVHEFEPVFDKNSKILILGSFPSVISRKESFYYANKQNRFWSVLREIFEYKGELSDIKEKEEFLLKNKIALWDVIYSCDIILSSDSSIKNIVCVNLDVIFSVCDIKLIILNGSKAGALYKKYLSKKYDIPFVVLPSTSPANARWKKNDLISLWKKTILGYMK